MNSLKSKFGKFAVSNEEAKKINGGTPPEREEENMWCWSRSGGLFPRAVSMSNAVRLVNGGHADGCSSAY